MEVDSDADEREAFFRELEARHGGPISYEQLCEWDQDDSDAEDAVLNAAASAEFAVSAISSRTLGHIGVTDGSSKGAIAQAGSPPNGCRHLPPAHASQAEAGDLLAMPRSLCTQLWEVAGYSGKSVGLSETTVGSAVVSQPRDGLQRSADEATRERSSARLPAAASVQHRSESLLPSPSRFTTPRAAGGTGRRAPDSPTSLLPRLSAASPAISPAHNTRPVAPGGANPALAHGQPPGHAQLSGAHALSPAPPGQSSRILTSASLGDAEHGQTPGSGGATARQLDAPALMTSSMEGPIETLQHACSSPEDSLGAACKACAALFHTPAAGPGTGSNPSVPDSGWLTPRAPTPLTPSAGGGAALRSAAVSSPSLCEAGYPEVSSPEEDWLSALIEPQLHAAASSSDSENGPLPVPPNSASHPASTVAAAGGSKRLALGAPSAPGNKVDRTAAGGGAAARPPSPGALRTSARNPRQQPRPATPVPLAYGLEVMVSVAADAGAGNAASGHVEPNKALMGVQGGEATAAVGTDALRAQTRDPPQPQAQPASTIDDSRGNGLGENRRLWGSSGNLEWRTSLASGDNGFPSPVTPASDGGAACLTPARSQDAVAAPAPAVETLLSAGDASAAAQEQGTGRAPAATSSLPTAGESRRLSRQMGEMTKQYRRERADWRAEREALRAELAAARSSSAARAHVAAGGSLAELGMSSDDAARLDREIQEQEALLSGYQRENERLSDALRAAAADRRRADERHEVEIGRLNAELFSHREGVGRAEQSVDAQRSRIAQADARAARAEEGAAEREAELKFEIDRLRSAKRELEGKLAGVDVGAMEGEASALAAARDAMQAERDAHQKELAAVSARLAWYVENQRIIDEVEAEADALRERLQQVDQAREAGASEAGATAGRQSRDAAGVESGSALTCVPAAGAPSRAGGAHSTRAAQPTGHDGPSAAHTRVAALEKQISHLTEMLQRTAGGSGTGTPRKGGAGGPSPHRPPTGKGGSVPGPLRLGELLAAVGPTAAEAEERRYLSHRVSELEAERDGAAAAAERRLRGLRQQHDRLAAGYERRVDSLARQLKEAEAAAAAKGQSGSARVRVRELEKTVEDVRAFYGRKVKELEARLAEAEAKNGRKSETTKPRPPATRTPILHDGLAERLGVSSAQAGALPPDGAVEAATAPPYDGPPLTACAPAADVTGPVKAAELGPPGMLDATPGEEGQGACLSSSWLADEATVLAHQRATAAMAERLEELASAALEATGGLVLTLDVACDGYALADAPTQLHLMLLRDQMRSLELRQQRRAHEAALLLEDAKRLAAAEVARVRREMAAEVEGKEVLLEACRREMDGIVREMSELYEQQLREEGEREAGAASGRGHRHHTHRHGRALTPGTAHSERRAGRR